MDREKAGTGNFMKGISENTVRKLKIASSRFTLAFLFMTSGIIQESIQDFCETDFVRKSSFLAKQNSKWPRLIPQETSWNIPQSPNRVDSIFIPALEKNVLAEDKIAADTQFNGNFALMEGGEYEIARDGWEDFLKKYPENSQRPYAEFSLAVCQCHTGQFTEAENLFQKLLADGLYPQQDEIFYFLGVTYLKHATTFPIQPTGSRVEAVNTVADRSYAISAKANALYRQAIAQFQELKKRFPDSQRRMEAIFGEAQAFIQLGNYENALGNLKLVVSTRQFADLNQALYLLAEVHLNLPKPDEQSAMITLQTLLENAPEPEMRLRALRLLGDICFRMEDYAQANVKFQEILKNENFAKYLCPKTEVKSVLNLAFFWYRSGETFMKLRDYQEAVEMFGKIPADFPESSVSMHARYQKALAMKKFNENLAEGAEPFDLSECAKEWELILQNAKVKKDRSLRNSTVHQLALYHLKNNAPKRALETIDSVPAKQRSSTLKRDRADALRDCGQSAEAAAEYRLIFHANQSPKSLIMGADAMLQAVQIYAKEKDFQNVLQSSGEIILWDGFARLPELLQTAFLNEHAQALFQTGDYSAAQEAWEQMLKRYPKAFDRDLWILSIAYCLQKNGESKNGFEFIRKQIKEISGEHETVELRHLWGICYRDYAQTKKSQKLISKYLNSARIQLVKAKNAGRKIDYSQLDLLYYDLSMVYFLQKNYEKCRLNTEFGLKRCPESPLADELAFLKARCEVEIGKFESAAKEFEAFLKTFPESELAPEAALLAAQCFLKSNQTEKAVQISREMSERFSESGLRERGANVQAVAAMEAADFDAAIEAWKVILDSDSEEFKPLHPEAQYEIGICQFQKKDFAAAEKTFLKLLKNYPDWNSQERTFNQLVRSFLEQKKLQDAQDRLAEMHGKFPSSIFLRSLYFQLGSLWFSEGKMENAENAFRIVLNKTNLKNEKSSADPEKKIGKENVNDDVKTAQTADSESSEKDKKKSERKLASKSKDDSKTDSKSDSKSVSASKSKDKPKTKSDAKKLPKSGKSKKTPQTEKPTVTNDFIQWRAEVKMAWTLFNQERFSETIDFINDLKISEKDSSDLSEEDKLIFESSRAELAFLKGMAAYRTGNLSQALKELRTIRPKNELAKEFRENALEMIVQIDEEKEKWEEVLADGSEFVEIYPQSAGLLRIRFKMAMALFRLNRLDEALAQCEPIIEANDAIFTPKTLFLKGEIFFTQKKHEQAIQIFYQIIYGVEDSQLQADAMFETAQCFEALGKIDKALKHYQDLLEKFPKSDKVKLAKRKMKKLN